MELKQASLNVDPVTKNFHWSAPVYRGTGSFPTIAAVFLSSMPAETKQLVVEHKQVVLREHIPRTRGSQPTLRQRFYQFLRTANTCREQFRSLAFIEKVRDAKACED